MYADLHVKYQLLLSDFNQTWISRHIFKKYSNTKFHENLSRGSRVISDGRSHRRTNMKKLTVAFRTFANAPKNAFIDNKKKKINTYINLVRKPLSKRPV